MNYKSDKNITILQEFTLTGDSSYNVGVLSDIASIRFFVRKKESSFEILENSNFTYSNGILTITNREILENYNYLQICRLESLTVETYNTDVPNLVILKDFYNNLATQFSKLSDIYRKSTIKSDDISNDNFLPHLEAGEVWVKDEKGFSKKIFNELTDSLKDQIVNYIKEKLDEAIFDVDAGGNAQYLQGYTPIDFLRKEDNISSLENSSKGYSNGDIIKVLGYYSKGDSGEHFRKVGLIDEGFGVKLKNGLYANIIHSGKINVLWIGIKGDGVTDNTVLIQKLFDTYVATTFYFPKGIYITDPLLVRYHQRIVGEGWNTILKLKNNSTSTKTVFIENEKITIAGKEYTGEHVEIHDIMIDGNKQNNTIERHGVVLKETWGGEMMLPDCPDGRHYLHRVFVINHTGNGIWGQAREMMITDSFSARNLGNGLLMYSSDSYISNFTSFQNSKCGIVNSGEDHKYSNIKCFGNGVVRRDQTAYAGFRSTYACTVSTISVQENGGAGIECVQMSRSTFTGVFLSSNNLTLDNDANGYPYPHPTEKYQIKLSGCFGQHIFNGVTLSDFRKTLVKKIFYCEGSNAYLTADVSCDPNTPIAKEDILTIIPENERIYYNRFKVNFNGLDILREGNNNYPVHTGVRNCCRIARVKILRVQGKGSSIYFDVAVSASKAYRKVRVGCELSEASDLNINIYNISNEVSARVEFLAGSTEVTNDYIYFDLYATNINWTFINTSFDNFSGFYSSAVDTSIIPLDAEPVYTKPLEAFPDDWYKSKTITRTRYPNTNDVFTNSYEIAPNVIAYTAVYESTKPTNVDVNSPLSHYLPLPEPDITHDNVVSVVINPAGYATAPWIGAFGFETSYDISDSAFYLKVAKTHTAESDAGASKPKLRHLITVVVNYNEEEII